MIFSSSSKLHRRSVRHTPPLLPHRHRPRIRLARHRPTHQPRQPAARHRPRATSGRRPPRRRDAREMSGQRRRQDVGLVVGAQLHRDRVQGHRVEGQHQEVDDGDEDDAPPRDRRVLEPSARKKARVPPKGGRKKHGVGPDKGREKQEQLDGGQQEPGPAQPEGGRGERVRAARARGVSNDRHEFGGDSKQHDARHDRQDPHTPPQPVGQQHEPDEEEPHGEAEPDDGGGVVVKRRFTISRERKGVPVGSFVHAVCREESGAQEEVFATGDD